MGSAALRTYTLVCSSERACVRVCHSAADRSLTATVERFSLGHCAAQVLREFRVTERVRKWTEEYVLRLNLCTRCTAGPAVAHSHLASLPLS